MRFRSHDALEIFDAVARNLSLTKAAGEVNQSKGSISYQINKLEAELGFRLTAEGHAPERCRGTVSGAYRGRNGRDKINCRKTTVFWRG